MKDRQLSGTHLGKYVTVFLASFQLCVYLQFTGLEVLEHPQLCLMEGCPQTLLCIGLGLRSNTSNLLKVVVLGLCAFTLGLAGNLVPLFSLGTAATQTQRISSM